MEGIIEFAFVVLVIFSFYKVLMSIKYGATKVALKRKVKEVREVRPKNKAEIIALFGKANEIRNNGDTQSLIYRTNGYLVSFLFDNEDNYLRIEQEIIA